MKTSLWVSSLLWIILCMPLYIWPIIEERRRRKQIAGFESFCESAAASRAGSRAGSRVGSFDVRSTGGRSLRSNQTAVSVKSDETSARHIDIGEARRAQPLLSVQRAGDA